MLSYQFAQHARQTLLRDLQDFQEIGDAHARIAVNEIQHAVMGAPETDFGEDAIGLADEVAIGQEEGFDEPERVSTRGVKPLRERRNRCRRLAQA
jgi:hypothetical protein